MSKYFTVDKFTKDFCNGLRDLRLMHLNIRSLCPKIDIFKTLLASFCVDFNIICLSETWLTADTVDGVEFANFNHFYNNRIDGRRGGGVSVLVSRSVNCTILDEFSISLHCVECIFIKCSIGGKSLIVGIIYRPPNGDVTEFFTVLNNIMSRLEQIHCDI